MLKDVLKNLKQHCMSGISYMIPVIVIGGFCTALARLAGNVDTAGTFPRFKSFEINVSDRYLSGNIRNYSDAVDHVCLWTASCSINTGSY